MYEGAVGEMRKKLKPSSDGGDSGSNKCKRGCGGTYGGVWRNLYVVGIWDQASRFCVGAFDSNLASIAVEIFHNSFDL
jgi:hypothetical protein